MKLNKIKLDVYDWIVGISTILTVFVTVNYVVSL